MPGLWKTAELLVLMTVFAVPIFLMPSLRVEDPFITFKSFLSSALVFPTLGVVVLAGLWGGERIVLRPVLWVGLALFLGIFLLSAITSPYGTASRAAWPFFAVHGAVFWIAAVLSRRSLFATRMKIVILCSGVVVAAIGLLQYHGLDALGKVFPLRSEAPDSPHHITSTIGNPEYLASYLAPLLLLLVPTLAGSAFFRPATWGAILAALVLLLALVLTAARGAWIGLAAGFVFLVAIEAPRRSARWRRGLIAATAALLILLVSVMAVFSFPNPINRRDARVFERFGQLFDLRTDSVKERVFFYNIAAKIIGESPWLGLGPGTFRMAFYPTLLEIEREEPRAAVKHFATTLRSRVAFQVHNDWLEFWVEGGTLGLAALSLFLAAAARLIADALRILPHESPQSRDLRALSAALLCLFVGSLFNFSLHLPNRALLFWACLGAAAGIAEGALGFRAKISEADKDGRPEDTP